MTSEREGPALGEKDREIIAVGASVASGCLPCTKFHLRAASATGAGEEEILQAARDATRVRATATAIMARAGGLSPAEAGEPGGDSAVAGPLIRQLVSIAAAYAVNCTKSLTAHVAAARALGATDRQLLAAIEIACGVKDVAGRKARSEAGALLGLSEHRGDGQESAEGEPSAADRARGGMCEAEGKAGVGGCSCGAGDDAGREPGETPRGMPCR
jgi:AhpD family alkylhydroperoxidase